MLTDGSQVEHTVTEEITGVDLVSAQLRIAQGATLKELGLEQHQIQPRGCAIQCRITTEIPSHGFRPDSGTIGGVRLPSGRGVRLDHSDCFVGARISPFYDSLLVKCTCSASDWDSARYRALRALQEFQLRGVQSNRDFLILLLRPPTFATRDCWTTFVDDTPEVFPADIPTDRAQGLMRFLADAAVNGSHIQGQMVRTLFLRDSPGDISAVLQFCLTMNSKSVETACPNQGY